MILSKKFECTSEDLDSVVVALAKEIEAGWRISSIESHAVTMSCSIKRNEPEFSIELCRKEKY